MKKYLFYLLIIYLVTVPNVFAQEPATESGVQDRITAATNKPTAYIGSITDLTELNINLSRYTFDSSQTSGEIMQVMISEEDTEFAESGTTTQSIDFEDVAIGDFIIAMGFETREGVLEASRVLVTDTPTLVNETNYFGNIAEIGDETLILTSKQDSNDIDLVFDELDLYVYTNENGDEVEVDITDITEMDNVIVFTETIDEEKTATSIFIVPDNETTAPKETEL